MSANQFSGVCYTSMGLYPSKLTFQKIHSRDSELDIFEKPEVIHDFVNLTHSPVNVEQFILCQSYYSSLAVYDRNLTCSFYSNFCKRYIHGKNLNMVKYVINDSHCDLKPLFKKPNPKAILVIPYTESDQLQRWIAFDIPNDIMYIFRGHPLGEIGKTLISAFTYFLHSKRMPKFSRRYLDCPKYGELFPLSSYLLGNFCLHKLLLSYTIVDGVLRVKTRACIQSCYQMCVLTLAYMTEKKKIIAYIQGKHQFLDIGNLSLDNHHPYDEDCLVRYTCIQNLEQEQTQVIVSTHPQSPVSLSQVTGRGQTPAVELPYLSSLENPPTVNDALSEIIADLGINEHSVDTIENNLAIEKLCAFLSGTSLSRCLQVLSNKTSESFPLLEECLRVCPALISYFADKWIEVKGQNINANFLRNHRFAGRFFDCCRKYKINVPTCLYYRKIKKVDKNTRAKNCALKEILRVRPDDLDELDRLYGVRRLFTVASRRRLSPFYTGRSRN